MPSFFSDLHVHTNRSLCAPRAKAMDYIPYCKQEGIHLVGISNHIYVPDFLKMGNVYEDPLVFLLSAKPEVEAANELSDVRFLFGCEVENFPSTGLLLRPEDAHHFDYLLIAASHICNWKGMYSNYDLNSADVLRKLTIQRFFDACKADYSVPVGICHPLYPIGTPLEQEIVDGISDECYTECFSLAAEKGFSIEIHACLYRNGTALNEHGLSDSYLRMLSIAKKCGCKFHFGSDSHYAPDFVGVHERLFKAAELLGITEDDLWGVAKGIL